MATPQEKYKLSRYNVFHQDCDVQYVWNTYSGALLKFDKSSQEYVRSFSGVDDGSNEFCLLKSNGFIVHEKLNEYARICLEEKQALFNPNPTNVAFLIAPGMKCNNKCSYCFLATQSSVDRTKTMTPEIASDVAKYICSQLDKNPNVSDVLVTWFGGEPLLHLDIIEIISRKIIKYTDNRKINYSADMPTNALLLNPDVLRKLHELRITQITITVDGLRNSHCISKGVSLEEYDTVIDNICYVAENTDIKRLIVRLNIPNNNLDEAIATTDYLIKLHGLLGKIWLCYTYVCDYTLPIKIAQKRYVEYTKNYLRWINYLLDNYGLSQNTIGYSTKRKMKYCMRASFNNYCIGSCGNLYRCLHSIGDKTKLIGDVWRGHLFTNVELDYYKVADIKKEEESKCFRCSFLPICGGGCIDRYKKQDCKMDMSIWLMLRLREEGVRL